MMKKIKILRSIFSKNPKKLFSFYQDLFLKIKKYKHFNFYTELYEQEVMTKIQDCHFWNQYQKKSLFGIPFFLKDNFLVKNKLTEGGSKILESFVASFSATVYRKLEAEGAILLGKTIMDELGLGGTGLEAKEGAVINPFALNRIVGGSSGGSAVALALKTCSFAIGSDTGDSVRAPASFLGVVGYKPTFGLVSRYGMIQYSPSLDSVGYFANNVEDLSIISAVLFGYDDKDFVSQKNTLPSMPLNYFQLKKRSPKILILMPPQEYVSSATWASFQQDFLMKLKKHNFYFSKENLELAIVENLNFIYQIISYAEALSSQAHLTGINYGRSGVSASEDDYQDFITKNRTEAFQQEIKRRYLLGAFFLEKTNQTKFYFKALRSRDYLNNFFNHLWQKYDFIIHLTNADVAPLITDIKQWKEKRQIQKNVSDFFLLGNLLGLPSLVLPFALSSSNQLPLGINIYSSFNQDWKLMAFAQNLEKILQFLPLKV